MLLTCLQDVQWNDIDYMERFLDFTFDPASFATLPDMVKDLHAHGQRYVMILVCRSVYCISTCVAVVSELVCVCEPPCLSMSGPRYQQHTS